MNEITQKEYHTEIRQIAKNILEELNIQTQEAFSDSDEIYDRLLEEVDGHQWIIYTYYNQFVIRFSNNEDYAEDNFGTESYEGKNYSEIGTIIAFWALYADVNDELQELFEDLPLDDEDLASQVEAANTPHMY